MIKKNPFIPLAFLVAMTPAMASSPSEGLPSFRKLQGSFRGKSAEELKEITEPTLKDCRQLDTSSTDLNNAQMDIIMASISPSQLTEINISYNDISGSYLQKIASFPNLKTLVVRHKQLFNYELEGLTSFGNLSYLDLSECDLNPTDLAHTLWNGLGKRSIEVLILEKLPRTCPLNLTYLCRKGGAWNKLKHINISSSWIYNESITPLDIESIDAQNLQFVTTTEPPFRIVIEDYSADTKKQINDMPWPQRLISDQVTALNLSNNNLTDKDLRFLKSFKKLKTLILEKNPKLNRKILGYLPPSLTYLDLSDTAIRDEIYRNKQFSGYTPLHFPPLLESLYLNYTPYKGEYLEDTINLLPHLKSLYIENCPLTESARKVYNKFKNFEPLQYFLQ
ncbi:MAG: hypothetical protein KBB83_01125 [Alphaproteobacteria bacterium]|nr:hypothetical protein [Alphaproteobacteria bacterium]